MTNLIPNVQFILNLRLLCIFEIQFNTASLLHKLLKKINIEQVFRKAQVLFLVSKSAFVVGLLIDRLAISWELNPKKETTVDPDSSITRARNPHLSSINNNTRTSWEIWNLKEWWSWLFVCFCLPSGSLKY